MKGSTAGIPIIDTHQHLWDLNRLRLPWLDAASPLAKSHLPADYLEAARGLGIEKTVYMEVDVDPAQLHDEADYVFGLCADSHNPMAACVLGGRPAHPEFPKYLHQIRRLSWVRGVRQVLHTAVTAGDYCLQPAFVDGIRLLGKHHLTFDLCLPPDNLKAGARLADLAPETRFILDHCGNANVQKKDRSSWKRAIDEVAGRPNVICKISGIVASAKPNAWSAADLAPIVEHCAAAFGPDRIVFGSDWPVCTIAATYAQWVTALREIVSAWLQKDQAKLFHENASSFYNLG